MNLRPAFSLGQPQPIAWAFSETPDNSLFDAAQNFISLSKTNGSIAQLSERIYGSATAMQQHGSRVFVQRLNERLPQYQTMFTNVADEFDIDWRLLAAISYQESHWNPTAESPTGVRGMMMLTKATALEVGVDNRLDTRQSLRGGAQYLRNIYKRLPASIPEPDRTWFALAAYNVGLGHLEDARRITDMQGGDPSTWVDVKQRLPLLKQAQWHTKLRHGYARGDEPVHFVQRIRHYYDLLSWNFPQQDRDAEFLISLNQLAYSDAETTAAKTNAHTL
jgi:membrane-bound lytic murein transglycosylase F